jgi:hypothetical protein
MVYYLALFARQGYRMNSLEVPAYDQEYRVLAYCSAHNIHGISPPVSSGTVKSISPDGMIFREAPLKDKPHWSLLIASFIISLLIAIVRPVADVCVFFAFFLPAGKLKAKKPQA